MKKTFNVYENIIATCEVSGGEVKNVKLVTKVPRGQYYSFLNDASIEAEKLFGNGSN